MSLESNHKETVLVVALGGGGDSVTAHLLATDWIARGFEACVASLAWERFVTDPLPGPRHCSELSCLTEITNTVGEVTATTAFPAGIKINQATLVQSFPNIRHFILDPYGGVSGLISDLRYLCHVLSISKIIGVDVGGDVLANHPFPSLRSPLADAMLVASIYAIDPDASIYVCGMGLDGEIPMDYLNFSISEHLQSNDISGFYTAPLNLVENLVPLVKKRLIHTETTALYLYAHHGMYGNVLVRDAGSIVRVGIESTIGLIYSARNICEKINRLSLLLIGTRSIEEASHIVKQQGFLCEFFYENELYKKHEHKYLQYNEKLSIETLCFFLSSLNKNISYVAERHIAHMLKTSVHSIQNVLSSIGDQSNMFPPFLRVHSPE
ncbi:MAG: DUF1152 domain-containing protein [Gammaproteobacteria bacterium]